ncbi:MAG: HU family DNA-binding protein [Flavobacteriaceae bacterium]|jgi:predicted histone-like DNA-binding protein|nr:HU family DNA-binding protein [Flavobacteriaceae bacterium]
MKYKLIERGKPGDLTAPKKWYASPVKIGTVTQKTLGREIADRSSLTAGDVGNVIQNLLELLPYKLIEGNSVQLGDFGTFRVSFSSEGTDTQDAFHTEKIKGLKILFTPSPDFKKKLLDIQFEQDK